MGLTQPLITPTAIVCLIEWYVLPPLTILTDYHKEKINNRKLFKIFSQEGICYLEIAR